MLDIIFPGVAHYRILTELEHSLPEFRRLLSPTRSIHLKTLWINDFWEILDSSLAVKKRYESAEYVSLKACDSIACRNIQPKPNTSLQKFGAFRTGNVRHSESCPPRFVVCSATSESFPSLVASTLNDGDFNPQVILYTGMSIDSKFHPSTQLASCNPGFRAHTVRCLIFSPTSSVLCRFPQ
ncbi:hypothetical protein DFH06DRAFT_61924 [Mycena polygramma]|nr:hypothetical protein DFH06DRAFT_61924 [Mycena polygramma]